MSFDPFETRLHFLQLVRRLNASQASIHKVVSFAIKYGSRCGEDFWECVVEEASKVFPLLSNPLDYLLSFAPCCKLTLMSVLIMVSRAL